MPPLAMADTICLRPDSQTHERPLFFFLDVCPYSGDASTPKRRAKKSRVRKPLLRACLARRWAVRANCRTWQLCEVSGCYINGILNQDESSRKRVIFEIIFCRSSSSSSFSTIPGLQYKLLISSYI